MPPWLEELDQGVSVPLIKDDPITRLFTGHSLDDTGPHCQAERASLLEWIAWKAEGMSGFAEKEGGSFVCSVSFGLNERVD
jgi:hypothetical protein